MLINHLTGANGTFYPANQVVSVRDAINGLVACQLKYYGDNKYSSPLIVSLTPPKKNDFIDFPWIMVCVVVYILIVYEQAMWF